MAQATHTWQFIDDVVIAMTSSGSISEDRWRDFVEDLKATDFRYFLGLSVGSPEANSVQRKQVNEILKEKQIPVCLITDERLVRGMATAASWFGIKIKAFAMSELDNAINHLNVEPAIESSIRGIVTEFYNTHNKR